jgi:hypothetical protein
MGFARYGVTVNAASRTAMTIIAWLARELEIRHRPGDANVDGRGSSEATAGYPREDLVAFPRAV